MCSLDRETRGLIEKGLDNIFQEQDFLETAGWVLEADDEVISQEDFVLGYFLGAAMMWANEVLEKEKIFKKIERKLERTKKKQGEELQQGEEKKARKKVRPYRVTVPIEEKETIKDILRLRISPFREKVRKELALKRADREQPNA
jgi:hypothetical protein